LKITIFYLFYLSVAGINEYINLFSTVRLCANYAEVVVTVQQIGPNACGFNGFKTQRGVRFVARHNDRLELLYGKHGYDIEFNPPPSVDNFALRKRLHKSETEETENRVKMSKLDNFSENCSEESENDREEEGRLPSNGAHINQKIFSTDSSTSSEQSNESSSTSAKWDSVDNGKLLIYTAPSVQNQAKVIVNYK